RILSPLLGGYGRRWAKNRMRISSLPASSWEQPDQCGAQRFRQRKRNAFPDLRRKLEAWVRRRKVWQALPPNQIKLIGQRPLAHTPLRFEEVRTRPQLAASEVVAAQSTLARAAQDFPVHVIVGRELPAFQQRTAVIRQDRLTETETQHGRERFGIGANHHHFRGRTEFFEGDLEKPLPKNG